MRRPVRITLTIAPPVGIALLAASLVAAGLAGAAHSALRPFVVFVIAFPVVWIALATALSYTTARALGMTVIEIPSQTRAMESFRLAVTFAYAGRAFPAIGVLVNARFSSGEVAIEDGPWAQIPVLERDRAATAHWDVTAKQRGRLVVGPFRAAVELPGSAIRATAHFDVTCRVTVLPALYQLQPFVDALLAGRHVAAGRFQTLPAAIEEYVGAREYRPGDSPKLIHRVLSLRAREWDRFYIREFKDPSRDDLSVVLDTSRSLRRDDALYRYRFEKAICFVSALCRTFATRKLTVRFVCQRGMRDVLALRVRPLDVDLDRLDRALAEVPLTGERTTLERLLLGEVQRHGAAVIFVSLRAREPIAQLGLSIVTLTPDHVPVFTREIAAW